MSSPSTCKDHSSLDVVTEVARDTSPHYPDRKKVIEFSHGRQFTSRPQRVDCTTLRHSTTASKVSSPGMPLGPSAATSKSQAFMYDQLSYSNGQNPARGFNGRRSQVADRRTFDALSSNTPFITGSRGMQQRGIQPYNTTQQTNNVAEILKTSERLHGVTQKGRVMNIGSHPLSPISMSQSIHAFLSAGMSTPMTATPNNSSSAFMKLFGPKQKRSFLSSNRSFEKGTPQQSNVSEMLAAAAAVIQGTNSQNLLEKGRVLEQRPTNGIQWLFDAAASSEALQRQWQRCFRYQTPGNSPERITPFPVSVNAVASEAPGDAWDFSRPEDNIDDELLFRREELQRRKNPRYLAKTKRLHDLHIVMPICVPYGEIVVNDPLGSNFYKFSKKHPGAHILFGKGMADDQKKTESIEDQSTSTDSIKANQNGKKANGTNPVCDVWASFLHVRLGTIYNLTSSQMPIVAELFKRSFDQDLCKFYVPIAMDCRGVHPSSDALISQRAGRSTLLIRENRDGRKVATERYETHATPTSENDIKRIRMLRRHLRRFAMKLITDLGFDVSPALQAAFSDPVGSLPRLTREHPHACIELHDNCRSDTILRGSLKIVVREWSPLSDPEVFKKVWAGQLASSNSAIGQSKFASEVHTKLLEQKTIPSARVLMGEIRLEHDHLRMVDPRWPDELVPGRRVADQCPENEAPGPEESQARFIFCSRVPKPRITYAYAQSDGVVKDPRDAVLSCRLSALFKIHLARHPLAGVKSLLSAKSAILSATNQTPEPGTEGTDQTTEVTAKEEKENLPCTETTPTCSAKATDELPLEGTAPDGVESAEKKERPDLERRGRVETLKPITSFNDLQTLPDPFVPCLQGSQSNQIWGTMPETLKKMLHQASEAANISSDRSALKEDVPFRVHPLTNVACKFFVSGGCARGTACYFFHPADPKLESKIDVRHIVPKHPKFF